MKLITTSKVAFAISSLFILAAIVVILTCPSEKNEVIISSSHEMRCSTVSDTATAETKLININTSSEDELCALPGIGKCTAAEIIAYRTQHGDFSDIYAIIDVSGIGLTSFEEIKDKITVKPVQEA